MALPADFVKKNNEGIVLGLADVAGVEYRKDIDQLLYEDPETFNLFLLALEEIQKPEMSRPQDIMGFCELAGIHGMPRRPWNGIAGKKNLNLNSAQPVQSGYCAHGVVTFPTWHRPYVAMLEQSLFVKMHEIASAYNEPHKTKYLKAAKKFRFPFWDYYRPRGGAVEFKGIIDNGMTSFPYDYSCPKVLIAPDIMVNVAPDDKPEQHRNPLSRFVFSADVQKAMSSDFKAYFGDTPDSERQFPRNETVRYPEFDKKWGTSTDTLNLVLNGLRMDSNRLAINMIEDAVYANYEAFATNRKVDVDFDTDSTGKEVMDAWPSGSLEALHGLYHGLVGGQSGATKGGGNGGHMSSVPVAAFDPIFWLHHCQIDRLFAVWQGAHNKSWFSSASTAKSELVPFFSDPDGPAQNGKGLTPSWTSDGSRKTTTFGYRYPILEDDITPEQVVHDFKQMYEWSIPLNRMDTSGVVPVKGMEPIDVSKTRFFQYPNAKAPKLLSEETQVKSNTALADRLELMATPGPQKAVLNPKQEFSYEWFIDDEVERLALNGSFSIFYFIVTEDMVDSPLSHTFATEPTMAGLTYNFAAPVEVCDNCGRQDEQALIVTNTVAVTSALLDFVDKGELASLEPEIVRPFLTRRLKWRIMAWDGRLIDPRQMAEKKHFKVNVSVKKARLPRGSGDVSYTSYPDVVAGIIGQASSAADLSAS